MGGGFYLYYTWEGGFSGGLEVKNLPAMQETWVSSLGWYDPLEKEMAAQSRMLAWEIPWTEDPGGLESLVSQIDRHDRATKQQTTNKHIIGK